MGLLSGRALADRARIVRDVAVGPVVEGRRATTATSLDWMPARLVLAPSREVDGDGRRRIVESGQVVCTATDVKTSDELDIESVTAGDGRWRVTGRPQTIVTRRLGFASVIPVERLHEAPAGERTRSRSSDPCRATSRWRCRASR